MTFQNRKTRRAAQRSTGHRKGALGGHPAPADHTTCAPGAPCCDVFHADREWFAANPGVTHRVREMISGEFDGADPAAVRKLRPDSMVLVWRLSPITNARIPLTAEQAATFLRTRGGRRHD